MIKNLTQDEINEILYEQERIQTILDDLEREKIIMEDLENENHKPKEFNYGYAFNKIIAKIK